MTRVMVINPLVRQRTLRVGEPLYVPLEGAVDTEWESLFAKYAVPKPSSIPCGLTIYAKRMNEGHFQAEERAE